MAGGSPVLNENTFRTSEREIGAGQTMTLQGTVNRAGALTILTILSASFTWWQYMNSAGTMPVWVIVGAIGGLVLCFVTVFKPNLAPFTSPIYAICEGLFLGGISAAIQAQIEQPIVIQAIALTFGILLATLAVYSTRIVRVTQRFRAMVVAATVGIMLFYLAAIVLSFFGIAVPLIHSTGMMGIGFSIFVVVIATMNLFLDFDLIESGVQQGAPKYMEWYGAFALLVTLVWLYIEVLRLLSKLNRR
jgi:uncharacterized YccA/Bax inhibitor family protein